MASAQPLRSRLRTDNAPTPLDHTKEPTWSSLRSRLGSEEASRQQQGCPAIDSASLGLGSPAVLNYFRRVFGAEVSDSSARGCDAKEFGDALAQFKDSLAHAGADLHSAMVNELVETHSQMTEAISAYAGRTARSTDGMRTLYDNIAHPVSVTTCSLGDQPVATLLEHSEQAQRQLAAIRTEVLDVQARLDDNARQVSALVAEWEALQGSGATDKRAALDKSSAQEDLIREVRGIYKDQVQELRDIEAEYKKKSKTAMARIMQGLVEGHAGYRGGGGAME